MIHLFDKLYVTYAEVTVGPGSHDRFPEKFVRIIDKGLSGMSHENYGDNEIAFGKNLHQVLSQFESDEDFFNKLLEGSEKRPKVIIYADEKAMLEFLIRYWKGIFPNLTAEGGYALYKIFADSETLRSAKSLTFLDITVKSDPITFDKFGKDYWDENKKMFTEKFNYFQAFNLTEDMKRKCSVEYHVMDYMANGFNLKPTLAGKIEHLYKKEFIKEVSGVARISQEFLYQLAYEQTTFKDFSLLDGKSLKEVLEKDNRFRALLDTKIQESMEGYNYVINNYELKTLAENLLSIELLITEKLGQDRKGVELDNPCLKDFSESSKMPDMENILKLEIEGKSNYKIFSNLARKNKLNPFIIPALRNLVKEDKNSNLVKEFIM